MSWGLRPADSETVAGIPEAGGCLTVSDGTPYACLAAHYGQVNHYGPPKVAHHMPGLSPVMVNVTTRPLELYKLLKGSTIERALYIQSIEKTGGQVVHLGKSKVQPDVSCATTGGHSWSCWSQPGIAGLQPGLSCATPYCRTGTHHTGQGLCLPITLNQ